MHQETKPGEATPSEAESIVGAQVDFERMGAAAGEGEEKIYKYVQEPLRKWLANFDTVVVRPSRCVLCCRSAVPAAKGGGEARLCVQIAVQTVEQLRLTLDSRRRSVATIEGAPLGSLLAL